MIPEALQRRPTSSCSRRFIPVRPSSGARANSLEVAHPIEAGTRLVGGVDVHLTPSLSPLIETNTWPRIWGGLALTGFITPLTYIGARIITKPFHSPFSSARAMGRGELNTTISAQGTEETVTLGSAIESMRIELKGFYYNLEHQG